MEATITRDGRVTTAEVAIDGEGVVGVGSATCDRDDHYVAKIGDQVSLARALQDLGKKMEAEWVARAVTKADVAARRAAAAATAQKTTTRRRPQSAKKISL